MTRRNVWLSYQEWVLLCEQLKDEKYHPFMLNKSEKREWKSDMKYSKHYDQKCFERVSVYPWLDIIGDRNVKVYNALCREYYRSQDFQSMLHDVVTFAGFIINNDDKNCHDNVPFYQWELRMNKVYSYIQNSDRKFFADDIMKVFYQECMPHVLVAHNITKRD